ncbi:MAG: hypothetical protein H7Y17_09205 [Chlorobia bacterium]|nr:hypothetical protein [Fimbriimonadaceae bacterium]
MRTALFQSKETPVSIAAAKKVLQQQRVKEANMAATKIMTKFPTVKIEIVDAGFDRPLHVAVTSKEKGGAPPPKGPTVAGGGGGGKGGTLIGSPAPDPNAGPGGTLKASPPPPPKGKPSGTLKGSPAPDPNVGPTGTLKGPPKIPDGVYAVKDAKNVVDPASLAKTVKADPASSKTANADPALGKTVKADPPPGKPGDPDPALAKTANADPAALGKTDPAVSPSQLKDAVGELKLADNGQGPLGAVRDWNILDPNAAQHSYGGIELDPVTNQWVSTKSKAPIGTVPDELDGVSTKDYTLADLSRTIAKNKGLPDYEGQWIGLPAGRFVVEPNSLGGSSVKFILKDTATGELYIFKPAAGEMPLGLYGHKADGRTLFVRGAFAARLAADLPAIGDALPFVTVVVHEGRVGSLQPFKKGTVDLETLRTSKNPTDQALYNKVMKDDPGFTNFRNNLRAFDHVINNSDRDTNPGNIMIHEDPVTKKITYYAIDQDASLAPGAKTVLDPRVTLLPRANLNDSWTDPTKPVMGKISKTLYNQMVALIANEGSARLEWKKAYALNDSALDGVMGRMRELVADFADRRTKAKDSEVFLGD